MTKRTVEAILKRYDKAVTVKDQYRDVHQAAYEYAIPARNLYDNKTQGDARMDNVYDSTGIRATNAFVNNMQASITPPFKKWVSLRPGPFFDEIKESDNEQEVSIYEAHEKELDKATKLGFSILNSGNFNSAAVGFYYDLAVGTGIMLTLPSDDEHNVITFHSVPLEEVALERGVAGSVGSVFRKSKMPVHLVIETWPKATLSADLISMLKDDPCQEVCMIESTYKEGDEYYYTVIHRESQSRVIEKILPFNPWVVTRINRSPIDVYGTGPLITATPDLRMLQKAKELNLKNAQIAVFGIYTVADNDVVNPNTLTLRPGTFIPVSRNGGPSGPSIAPIPVAGNFQAQTFMMQELQAGIKELLFDDKLPDPAGPVRSPTEIVERLANIRKNTGSFFGPINQEFVQHLWQNILKILVMKQKIALPPELMKVDNFFVAVDILSPIAKEQDLSDVQSFVEAFQIYSTMAGPEAAAITFNLEKAGNYIAEKLGAPLELIRNETEKAEFVRDLQDQQKNQALQEIAAQKFIEGGAQGQVEDQTNIQQPQL